MTTETLIILLTFVVALAYYFAPGLFVSRRVSISDLLGPRDNIPGRKCG